MKKEMIMTTSTKNMIDAIANNDNIEAEKQFKSTIANELSARLELPIIHFHKDYGFGNGQFDYFDGYLRDARKNSNGIIFDRNFCIFLS